MALPAQAIEKLAHVPEKTPGVYSQLLMLSLSLLVLAVFLYAGLAFGYRPYLTAQTAKLETQINDFGKEIPLDKQEAIATFYSQLVNLRKVLANHNAVTPFWSWLEKNTSPNVYFIKATVNTAANQAVLQGGARGIDDIMNQLAAFERAPEVVKMAAGTISNTSQGWQFGVTLTFRDTLFKSSIESSSP